MTALWLIGAYFLGVVMGAFIMAAISAEYIRDEVRRLNERED